MHTNTYNNTYISPSRNGMMSEIIPAGGRRRFMRTTLNIEDSLLKSASELTGIKEKTTLVKLGLQALIEREAAKRLARLGGTEKSLQAVPRRRPAEK